MMKGKLVLLFVILASNFLNAQTFNLTTGKFMVGDVYTPDVDIFFELGNVEISPRSYYQLDSIAEFLLKNDSLVIEIGVHTDSRGSSIRSSRLDQKRAEGVKQYLIQKGVDFNRLIAKGFGDDELIILDSEIALLKTATEKEKAHAINRRTEFKIIGFKR